MSPVSVGIDLGPKHLRVGGLVIGHYIVNAGTKGLKANAAQPPSWDEVRETFQEAQQVVKSFFGAPRFQAAVVVLPNSTSRKNVLAIIEHARGAGHNVSQVIPEHTAIYYAYSDIVKPSGTKRLAIVSVTGQILDISILHGQNLEAEETHSEPIELAEEQQQPSHSKPPGVFGFVGGVVDTVVKTVLVDPLAKAIGIVEKLLSSPKLSESPVDAVVLVGKAAESEKLKSAVAQRFNGAPIWKNEGVDSENLAAHGAAVIAFRGETARPFFDLSAADYGIDPSPMTDEERGYLKEIVMKEGIDDDDVEEYSMPESASL